MFRTVSRIVMGIVLAGTIFLLSCSAQPSPAAAPTVSKPATQPTQVQSAPVAPTPVASAPAPTIQPSTAPTAQVATSAPPETIKVGIMTSLSGATTNQGIPAERWIRMGMDDLNAKGGFKVGAKTYKFDAVTADDKSTSEGGREAANKLVLADKVRYIMGGLSTPVAGAQAVTEPNTVAILSFATLDRSLGKAAPLTLQVGFPWLPASDLAVINWMAAERSDIKSIAMIYPDDPTSRGVADTAIPFYKQRNFNLVSTEFYPVDTKDFTPVVVRALRQNPQALDLGGLGGRGAMMSGIMTAARDQGFKGIAYSLTADLKVMAEKAAIMEGYVTMSLSDWRAQAVGDSEKKLIQKFVDKFGETALETNPMGLYNAPSLLAQGMEKAGTVDDVAKVIDTLRNGEWDSVYGKRGFGGAKTYGLPATFNLPIYLTQMRGGKLTVIKTSNDFAP